MWKRPESEDPQNRPTVSPPPPTSPSPPPAPVSSGARHGSAVVGPSIHIKGDLSGEEDLLVQGQVEGKIDLRKNNVTVGKQGRIKADIHGRLIDVEGQVEGNLFGGEQVVIRSAGSVRGNITAPRVSLEDGANFKGAIDMEPQRGKERLVASGEPVQAQAGKAARETRPAGQGEAPGAADRLPA